MMSAKIMDTMTARGLDVELADKMGFASVKRDGGREALVIPFLRAGAVVRTKFKFFEGEQRWSAEKGGIRCLWNEDCLRRPDLTGKPLIITEGELDAFTAIQCGFERTVSVPDGAPPPGDRDEETLESSKKYSWLDQARALLHKDSVPEIILATDGDEAGAALLQDLSVLLGRFRCKFLTYPLAREPDRRGRPRLKDLNEVLEDYGQKGVVEVVQRAQWIQVDGVYRLGQLPPKGPSRVYDVGFDAFNEHFRLRLGDLSVWTGTPGAGKTTLLQDVLCRCANLHGIVTAWASFEQDPQTDHRRAFREWLCEGRERNLTADQKALADVWIDKHHVFMVPDEDEDVTLDWLLEKAELAVVRFGAKVIVIDPWNEVDHVYDGRAETEARYNNRAIKTLKRFARAFQVHVAIVAHPTKLERKQDGTWPEPGLYDISGGAVWNNKADIGLVVHRIDEMNTKATTAKSRYHDQIGRPGVVVFQYCSEDRHFREVEHPGRKAGRAERLLNPDVSLTDVDARLFE